MTALGGGLCIRLHKGAQHISISHQRPIPYPSGHSATVNRGDREEATACFAFSPLCRGVSHQLALDRPDRASKRAIRGGRKPADSSLDRLAI